MSTDSDKPSPNHNEELDRKFGMFIEHMNDQFERVLEAVSEATKPIPAMNEHINVMSDRIAVIEHEIKWTNLKVGAIQNNTKMLKLRSDQDSEKIHEHEKRLNVLEQKAA